MAIALLKEIASVEEQADKIEAQALSNARDIIAAAKKSASEAVQKADEMAAHEAKKIIKEEEEKACNKAKEMQKETEAQCEQIRKTAEKNLQTAVELIVERVVKK
jgi:vacuolar-type H+-ATPase subunit H